MTASLSHPAHSRASSPMTRPVNGPTLLVHDCLPEFLRELVEGFLTNVTMSNRLRLVTFHQLIIFEHDLVVWARLSRILGRFGEFLY